MGQSCSADALGLGLQREAALGLDGLQLGRIGEGAIGQRFVWRVVGVAQVLTPRRYVYIRGRFLTGVTEVRLTNSGGGFKTRGVVWPHPMVQG